MMRKDGRKSFLIRETIKEIISISSLEEKKFIYSFKIDLPIELELIGSKAIFQELFFKLIKNAKQAYEDNLPNKIILITAKLENEKEFSLSVSDGGKGTSFLKKELIKYGGIIFRENDNSIIYKMNQIVKKEFKTKLKIISKMNKGTTIKYFFTLD